MNRTLRRPALTARAALALAGTAAAQEGAGYPSRPVTMPAIVKRLNEELYRAPQDPAVSKRMRELNFTDLPQPTPEQFKEVIRQDLQDWSALVKAGSSTRCMRT